jgi:hypothetical protein
VGQVPEVAHREDRRVARSGQARHSDGVGVSQRVVSHYQRVT